MGRVFVQESDTASASLSNIKPGGYVTNFNGTATSPVDLKDGDTIRCNHCSHQFRFGKGVAFGKCKDCGGTTCTSPECLTHCYPFEKRLDDYEQGILKVLT